MPTHRNKIEKTFPEESEEISSEIPYEEIRKKLLKWNIALEDYDRGLTGAAIGEKIGVSQTRVSQLLRATLPKNYLPEPVVRLAKKYGKRRIFRLTYLHYGETFCQANLLDSGFDLEEINEILEEFGGSIIPKITNRHWVHIEFMRDYKLGMRSKDLALVYGYSATTVSQLIKHLFSSTDRRQLKE